MEFFIGDEREPNDAIYLNSSLISYHEIKIDTLPWKPEINMQLL